MRVRTILVPTDFSDAAGQALVTAEEFARHFDARIVLLHAHRFEIPAVFASEGTFVFPDGFAERVLAEAKARVEEAAREIGERTDIDVEGVLVSDRAESAILAQAESLPADLIVMGTRGLSGLKHAVLGSVAERVVRLARCPVLTVNAADRA